MKEYLLEKTLRKDGCNIHYWISKDVAGPWVLFLHGAGLDHNMFKEQVEAIKYRNKILVWDARGHGLSRPIGNQFSIKLLVEDLINIMDIERIDKVVLVGQSMGGILAQEMAFYYPNRIDKLVLVDCPCNTMKLSVLEKVYIRIAHILMPMCPWSLLLAVGIRLSAIRKDVRNYIECTVKEVGKKDFVKIFLKTAEAFHFEEGYKINKKTLIVYGNKDSMRSIGNLTNKWCLDKANYYRINFNEASHCANQDRCRDFNRILINFLGNKE
ncbi:alpha/beta fold hydrolase [Clostridium sp. 'White wine YQ']|uniref:alpha/beta fold hydrolase n=1 Tax=Clostridium sp. 'White wine YQ' TaxID=3027474 RepID=UPI0023660663|nr:alpha/beta hydrolase [Clostridium sp. 'White wine YQ']MDD7793383.1 alpha/beta hydrolase [Clostridium sp. 'White wine YQ']